MRLLLKEKENETDKTTKRLSELYQTYLKKPLYLSFAFS